MKKWMYDCVLEAPENCRQILQNKDKLVSGLTDIYTSKNYTKIVIAASGSSFNIASCAKYAMEKYLGKKVEVIHSVTYEKYDYRFHEGALVLCLSQGGRSTNTLAALDRAKQCGNDVAALVSEPGSPLEQACEHTFLYGSHEAGKDVFVCRGVPTSTLFLILFALDAGVKTGSCTKEQYKKAVSDLKKAVELMPAVREKADAFYEANKTDLCSMERVMTVGIGPGLGVAQEGALKLEETVGLPSNFYEMEEFLHGPVYEIKKPHSIFLVDVDRESHDRALQIFDAMRQLTDHVYLVSAQASGSRVLTLDTDIDPVLLPLLAVIPFQVIASRICDDTRASGITIYTWRFMQKMATKAR